MRSKVLSLFLVVSVFLLLTGCQCKHEWVEATCISPKVCSKCEEAEGEALGHNWAAATCETPKTCSRCAQTYGVPVGHKWTNATCSIPKTCQICNATDGKPLEHQWMDATCTDPKICGLCKTSIGDPLGHTFSADHDQFGQVYNGWTVSSDEDMQIVRRCTDCNVVIETRSSQSDLATTTNSAVSNGYFSFSVGELVGKLREIELYKYDMGFEDFFLMEGDGGVNFLFPVVPSIGLAFNNMDMYMQQVPFIYFIDKNDLALTNSDNSFCKIGVGVPNFKLYPHLCNSIIIDLIQVCAPHFDEATVFIILHEIVNQLFVEHKPAVCFKFGSIELIAEKVSDDIVFFNISIP